jgi:hypothetical protein
VWAHSDGWFQVGSREISAAFFDGEGFLFTKKTDKIFAPGNDPLPRTSGFTLSVGKIQILFEAT